MNRPTTEGLPQLLGIDSIEAESGSATAAMVVRPEHLAPNGLVHAASIIALADTACGYGCLASLPAGRSGFATADLTAHYIGSAQIGDTLTVAAAMRHGGTTTQLWDATVCQHQADKSRDIAAFRCLQILLSPKTPPPTQN